MVQILHRGNVNFGHWFTVSTFKCESGCINVFDSASNDFDLNSKSQAF